jgi:cobalt-zinc-cadmium resistance protein CzcA
VARQFRSVPNVADVTTFGGTTREYQVQVDPDKLVSYGLSLAQVEQTLAANNVNAGSGSIERGDQTLNVRTTGLFSMCDYIGATVLRSKNGMPVRVRDIAAVRQAPKIRSGRVGKAIHHPDGTITDDGDVVEGIVLIRKGAEFDSTIAAVERKVKDLNDNLLPSGVKVVPHLNRSELVHFTGGTVLRNFSEGILLVAAILFLLLGSVRGVLIIALTIPFSLLCVSIFLDMSHVPASLLALGALDSGIVVSGAVVMIENICRRARRMESSLSITEQIKSAAHQVQRPIFYSTVIILIAHIPIFAFQRVEGKLLKPMALTEAVALLAGLVFSLVLAPVLASVLFRRGAGERQNPVLKYVTFAYRRQLNWCFRHSWTAAGLSLSSLAVALYLVFSGAIGSEFAPHLDEGAIWARGVLPQSVGPTESTRLAQQARLLFAAYPEVTQVVSQTGRPDDGTDPAGFFNTEYFIDLKPRDQRRPQFQTSDQLIGAMREDLEEQTPGVIWGFSQPIRDNLEESAIGVKGQLAVKLYGADLKELEQKGDEIVSVMSRIPGIEDIGLFRVAGQPNVNIAVDHEKTDRFGINVSDIRDATEAAVGGRAVAQVLDGERRFDVVVRYQEPYRRTIEDLRNVQLLASSGEHVPLSQFTGIRMEDGASTLYREGGFRYVPIKYGIRGRDLGNTVEQAMKAVTEKVKLPAGYHADWAGEYESQKRSQARLALIVPITTLIIFIILYSMFDSFKCAFLVLLTVAMAPIGGIFALYITGTYFSVSSAAGFLALFGLAVQTGVIMVEYINQRRATGQSIPDAALEGAIVRLRPIMMMMLVAALGLLPAATSHGIGSDFQRPFAIVIVGGLIVTLFMSTLLLPTLYVWFARPGDRLPEANGAAAE